MPGNARSKLVDLFICFTHLTIFAAQIISMNKLILKYTLSGNNQSCIFSLAYTISEERNSVTLTCYIEATYPSQLPWLQTRNFETKYIKEKGVCMPVFCEADYEKTVDAILLMTLAAKEIMARESYVVTAEEQLVFA